MVALLASACHVQQYYLETKGWRTHQNDNLGSISQASPTQCHETVCICTLDFLHNPENVGVVATGDPLDTQPSLLSKSHRWPRSQAKWWLHYAYASHYNPRSSALLRPHRSSHGVYLFGDRSPKASHLSSLRR